jgi:diamine N-acetyltransferase
MKVLRDATPSDLDILIPLVRDFCAHFGYPYAESLKRDTLAQVLAEPSLGRLWLILSAGGDVAGYLFLSFYFSLEYGGRTAFIDEIFVRPEHRVLGLGSAALRNALAAARDLGLTAVHLEAERSNDRAAALYVRLGFVDYDRRLLTRFL